MYRGIFITVFLILIFTWSTPASAAILLASYEPPEANCLVISTDPVKDPCLVPSWPVLGGVNGVPPSTEGQYVLELQWAGETDRKIEVRHDWLCGCWFDLAGYDYILADIYFSTDSSLPGTMGIWDDVFGWVSAVCLPCTRGEWRTVSFYVGNLEHKCLDHIFAFLFEDLAGDDGKLYIDNLRLGSLEDVLRRQINFAGYNWLVKDSGCDKHGPGPNYFSHSKENLWVDQDDRLHMKIANRCDKWFCSEVILNASPGYGKYVFTTEGRVDELDPNIVMGLFTWDTDAPHHHYREIDIEFSRWWDQDEPNNAQYVVQPWNIPGNRHRFAIDCSEHELVTHEIAWWPDEICFRSYYGDYSCSPSPEDIVESWCYTGSDIPPAGGENVRINFWLLPPKDNPWGTAKPTDGQEAEIVVKSFQYLPTLQAEISIYPRTVNLARRGRWIMCLISLPIGYSVADIDPGCVVLGNEVKADRLWSNGRRNIAFAKFNWSKVQQVLAGMEVPSDVELNVKGELTTGASFEGMDTIRVIGKPIVGASGLSVTRLSRQFSR